MYRIELSPGDETAFRSIEELAVAIRRGVVTSRARVWHNASSKWLPIQLHPHYKAAAAMQLSTADLVAGPPVKPLELLTLGELVDPPAPPEPVAAPAPSSVRGRRPSEPPQRAAEMEPQRRTPEMEPKPRKKSVTKSRRTKSGRRSLRIVLIGSLLIGGAHLAVSFASAGGTEDLAVLARTHRRLITTPTNAASQGRPETTAAAVLPGLPGVPQTKFGRTPASQHVHSEAATPPLSAFPSDTAVTIQPAPEAVVIAAPLPARPDSLSRKMVDSSGRKTLKRILRTIGGAAPAEQSRTKR